MTKESKREPNAAWKEICSELGKKVGEDVVDRWLSDARIFALRPDSVKLELPTKLHVDWVETYFRGDLVDALSGYLGGEPEVLLTAGSGVDEGEEEGWEEENGEAMAGEVLVKTRHGEGRDGEARIRAARLNSRQTMDAFVVGKSNVYAHASATQVVERPGEQYNPLLFFGNSGMGKTHLMNALGMAVLQRHPKKRVLFVTAEEFTNEFIEAVRRGKLTQFRAKYRKVDVLLIDDVQFLGGKEATQDEFCHTFNTLVNARSQVVLTCDRPPGEIPGLEKRLVSRFQWGISAEMLAPGLETRIGILRLKAHEMGLNLDSPVIEFMAAKIQRNVRNLESALLRISSYSSLYRARVTVIEAEEYLRDILTSELRDTMVTVAKIQQEVAEYFEVRLADLSGRSRTASIVHPRQIAMYLSREMTHASLKEIGRAFGGRDHGTVIHAWKKVSEAVARETGDKRILDYLGAKIAG